MEDHFVIAELDVDCDWEGLPPVYRIYVNDELFAEREWRWTDCYLTEQLQIQAPAGVYSIRLEAVGPCLARFKVGNNRVKLGPARWRSPDVLDIS